MSASLKKYIGNKAFYKTVLAVSVPVMVQNGVTNFVNLLDNVMVGRLGTEAMSGVSIVNQFIFIFNLLVFGAVSAASIFTAQYFGSKDVQGIRYTFRFKLVINVIAAALGVVCFYLLDDQLIGIFLLAEDNAGDVASTLAFGKSYLLVMLFGLLPYAISQVYASTMRETGDTLTPMIASLVAVLTNFLLNAVLIFGLLGFPKLGVVGAGIATVISRFAELAVLLVMAHTRTDLYPYVKGAYKSLYIPSSLFAKMSYKGLPLMMNEFLWAIAIMLRNQCYSTRGLEVVAAQNIQSTLLNVFNVVYLALGSSIAIIVGNQLGSGDTEKARDTDRKMIAFSMMCAAGMGTLFAISGVFFPMIYNTADSVRHIATYLMVVAAVVMPLNALANASYFTLRSGGLVAITFLFDSVYMWAIVLPISFLLAYFTPISIYVLFPLCQSTEIVKSLIGLILVRQGKWAKKIVTDSETEENT